MKFNLLSKFIITYFIIGILGFCSVTFIGYGIDYKKVLQQQEDSMYKETVAISKQYADSYFSESRLRSIELDLNTISQLSNSRIMFIDVSGNVILDTNFTNIDNNNNNGILYPIADFDYTLTGSKHSQIGTFYGIFDSDTLTVMAPITNSFTTKGYVAVHIPVSTIKDTVYNTFNTNYITLILMMLFAFMFIILYLISIHKPLTEVIRGTDEYGRGNLTYKIKSLNNDEIGHLGISLNYMASELNEMDKFQQTFISNVSHDFRSPLTSIKGYLEAIADGTIPPEMVGKYVTIVLFETERLTKLTSNILLLNDLDPKSVRLEMSIFDVNSIIKHTIETFEGVCKDKNISFDLTFSAKALFVLADKGKIQQVIYNLIDNAIKFSQSNSSVFVHTTSKGEKIFVSIKDTGVGIPKENLDKIWDRFYKSDASRGRDKKGSGLGLSITKEIIQAHNENIDVISTQGVGTEFIFTLPKSKEVESI